MSLLFLCLLSISLLLHIIYIFLSIVSIQSLIVMNISHHQITSFRLMLLLSHSSSLWLNYLKICCFHISPPYTARLLKSVLLFTHCSDLFATKKKGNVFIYNFLSLSACDTADPLTTLFKFVRVWFPVCFPQSLLWASYSFPSSGWLYSQEYCLLISFLLAHYLWHRKPLPTTSVNRSVLMILEYIFQIYIYIYTVIFLSQTCLVWPISMMGSGITLYHCTVLCHWTYTSHYNFLFLAWSILLGSMDNGGL